MYLLAYIILTLLVILIAHVTQVTVIQRSRSNESIKLTLGQVQLKNPLIITILLSVILSLFSASLGVEVSVDRQRYIYNFLIRYEPYYGSIEGILSANTEPGYVFLNGIIKMLTDNPYWLFFSLTFIPTLINLYSLSKITEKFTICVFLLLASQFFFYTTFLFKQGLAVAFANLALLCYLNDKKFTYFLFSLIACSFHSAAIIMFPLYFIFKYASSKKGYIIMISFFGLLFFLYDPFTKTILPRIPFLSQYVLNEEGTYEAGAGSLMSILKGVPFYIITCIALLRRDQLKKQLKHADIFIISAVIYAVSWFLSFKMYWFFRVGWFTMLPTLILVPYLLKTIKDKILRILVFLLIVYPLIFITLRQIYLTMDK